MITELRFNWTWTSRTAWVLQYRLSDVFPSTHSTCTTGWLFLSIAACSGQHKKCQCCCYRLLQFFTLSTHQINKKRGVLSLLTNQLYANIPTSKVHGSMVASERSSETTCDACIINRTSSIWHLSLCPIIWLTTVDPGLVRCPQSELSVPVKTLLLLLRVALLLLKTAS